MPSKQILVVTDHEDAHLPFVQRHLAEQMVLVDPINIATKQTLSFSFAKGGPRITLGGKKLKPTSVWYRKPMPVKADVLQIEQSYHGYALDALYKHTNALYAAFPDAFWVSDYYAIYRASDKPLQISLASTLGFRVP